MKKGRRLASWHWLVVIVVVVECFCCVTGTFENEDYYYYHKSGGEEEEDEVLLPRPTSIETATSIDSLEDLQYLFNYTGNSMPSEIGRLTKLVSLKLDDIPLTGTIPSGLGNLTLLTLLFLRKSTGLTGTIPTEIGALTRMKRLYIHDTSLNGTIPVEMGNLTALTDLNLRNNLLTGPFPSKQIAGLTRLNRFVAFGNQLEGSIFPDLASLVNLQKLYLNDNQLTGELQSLSSLSSLTALDLSRNRFNGTIPESINKLSSLTELLLAGNELEGDVDRFTALANVGTFDISANSFTGSLLDDGDTLAGIPASARLANVSFNKISGSIPAAIGSMSSTLTSLSLQANRFIGQLPSNLGRLSLLTSLMLRDNIGLTGTVPVEFQNNMLPNLEQFNIANTSLTNLIGFVPPKGHGSLQSFGFNELEQWFPNTNTIPKEIAILSSLTGIDLKNGSLVGTFPSELLSLGSKLKTLTVANNSLTGTLPANLFTSFSTLSNLDVSNNNFTGPVPSSGSSSQLQNMALQNNRFTGTISSTLGANLVEIRFDGNQMDGSIPSQLGQLSQLKVLHLNDNKNLTGTIPPTLRYLQVLSSFSIENTNVTNPHVVIPANDHQSISKEHLHAWFNWDGKTIPSELGALSTITAINLAQSMITGTVPSELGQITTLATLLLQDNQQLEGSLPSTIVISHEINIANTKVSNPHGIIPTQSAKSFNMTFMSRWFNNPGIIPQTIGKLTQLTKIDLSDGNLSQTIPSELGQLTNLVHFDLSDNIGLTGTLPYSFENLRDGLERFSIRNTSLKNIHAVIPSFWDQTFTTTNLHDWFNAFEGIPSELGRLTSMSSLNLTGSLLGGEIPSFVGQLSNLVMVDLSHNSFHGTIPAELGNLNNLEKLFLNDNQLTGGIPASFRNFPNTALISLGNNELSSFGAEPQNLWVTKDETGETDVILHWQPPVLNGHASYHEFQIEISWKTNVSILDVVVEPTLIDGNYTASMSGLPSNQLIQIRVRAKLQAGTYSGWSNSFQFKSKPCSMGFYAVSHGCAACPPGFPETDPATGASSEAECLSSRGWYTYRNPSTGKVESRLCAEDYTFGSRVVCGTIGLELENVPLKPGYWRIGNSSTDIRKCKFCSNNINKTIDSRRRRLEVFTSDQYCDANHGGILCQLCINENMAMKLGGCVECTSDEVTVDLIKLSAAIVSVLCAIGVFPAIWLLHMVRVGRKNSFKHLCEGLAMKIQIYGRIFFGFGQVATVFLRTEEMVSVSFGTWLSGVFDLNLPAWIEMLQAGCALNLDFYGYLFIQAMWPLVCIELLMLVLVIFSLMIFHKKAMYEEGKNYVFWISSNLVLLVLPGFCEWVLNAFLYDEMPAFEGDEQPYHGLRKDPTLGYNMERSLKWRVFTLLLMSVYVIAIISGAYRASAELLCPQEFYRVKWFEVYDLMRKSIQIVSYVAIHHIDPQLARITFIFMSTLALVQLEKIRPYQFHLHRVFANISLVALCFLALIQNRHNKSAEPMQLMPSSTEAIQVYGLLMFESICFTSLVIWAYCHKERRGQIMRTMKDGVARKISQAKNIQLRKNNRNKVAAEEKLEKEVSICEPDEETNQFESTSAITGDEEIPMEQTKSSDDENENDHGNKPNFSKQDDELMEVEEIFSGNESDGSLLPSADADPQNETNDVDDLALEDVEDEFSHEDQQQQVSSPGLLKPPRPSMPEHVGTISPKSAAQSARSVPSPPLEERVISPPSLLSPPKMPITTAPFSPSKKNETQIASPANVRPPPLRYVQGPNGTVHIQAHHPIVGNEKEVEDLDKESVGPPPILSLPPLAYVPGYDKPLQLRQIQGEDENNFYFYEDVPVPDSPKPPSLFLPGQPGTGDNLHPSSSGSASPPRLEIPSLVYAPGMSRPLRLKHISNGERNIYFYAEDEAVEESKGQQDDDDDDEGNASEGKHISRPSSPGFVKPPKLFVPSQGKRRSRIPEAPRIEIPTLLYAEGMRLRKIINHNNEVRYVEDDSSNDGNLLIRSPSQVKPPSLFIPGEQDTDLIKPSLGLTPPKLEIPTLAYAPGMERFVRLKRDSDGNFMMEDDSTSVQSPVDAKPPALFLPGEKDRKTLMGTSPKRKKKAGFEQAPVIEIPTLKYAPGMKTPTKKKRMGARSRREIRSPKVRSPPNLLIPNEKNATDDIRANQRRLRASVHGDKPPKIAVPNIKKGLQ